MSDGVPMMASGRGEGLAALGRAAMDHVPWDAGRALIGFSGSGRRRTLQSPNEALQPEAPPPPPPKPPSRRRPTLSALSGFLSFLVIVAIGALVGLAWAESRLNEPGPLQADKDIFIAPHTDFADVVEKLESDGVIESPFTFNVAVTVERKRPKIRAGEYLIKAHASIRDVIDTLVSGKQIQQAITIPEGLTSAQIVQKLRDDPMLVGEINKVPNEGALLPDTYKFVRGSSRAEILDKMEKLDRQVVERIWARRAPDLPLRSPYELVTLASMVEKETGKADERPMVAGVFINRLHKRMRLQSDPTIVYGLVQGQGTLGHSITRSELDKRTPYNTYQVDGLPPGPIDNPGRAALEAVANPSRTSNLYFVADGTGGHAFSDSVDAHNRNVQRWREIEREAKGKVDVDKLSPNAVTPPPAARPNQRSDAADPAYGTLPNRTVATTSLGRQPSFADPAVSHDIATIAAADDGGGTPPRRHGKAAAPAVRKLDALATSASLDSLGFTIEGVKPTAADLLDGPSSGETPQAPTPAVAAAAGVSSAALAQAGAATASTSAADAAAKPLDRRIARASLDVAPGERKVDLFADPDPSPAAPVPIRTPPAHPKIYDASEGTALDPLREKDYDLNSGKSIPADLLQH